MKKSRRSVALGLGVAMVVSAAAATPSAASNPLDPAVPAARGWLTAQQQADGGFELAGFDGFETSDAIAALAAAAQTGPRWDTGAATTAVTGLVNGTGKDPLDNIDDLVDADGAGDPTTDAAGARAAKVIVLVAEPLGMDPTDFDPSDDSAAPVDLVARMDLHRQGDGSYDFGAQFNGVLLAAVALGAPDQPVPAGLVAQIRAAQRSDGSWDYTGTPTAGPGDDIDTTALALIALRAAGLDAGDPDVAEAVAFMASRHGDNGAWQSFGADDPNSTALAAIALSDLKLDVGSRVWRDGTGFPAPSVYVSPLDWLRAQQRNDGRFTSPNDQYGVNTLPTSQSIQALARQPFLNDERDGLLDAWSQDLASPAAAPVTGQAEQVASDALGPNASLRTGRTAAAVAVLYGDEGRRAAAADLFQQALGRGIDPSGANYWSSKLASISRTEMLARLTGSSEFYRSAGSNTPGFVDAVYQSVLRRGPDPSGRAYWIRKLDGGASVRSVARGLIASNEYRRIEVNIAFDRLLGRAPSSGEQTYWTSRIAQVRVEELLGVLASSGEYYAGVGS